MFWYVVQLLVQLIIAFLLGLLVGWLLWARTLRKRTQLYARETKALQMAQDTRVAAPQPGDANALEELRAQAVAHAKQQAAEIRTAKTEIAALQAQLDAAPAGAAPVVVSPAVTTPAVATPAVVPPAVADDRSVRAFAASSETTASTAPVVDAPADAPVVSDAPDVPVIPDDLKRIEGIGPKMAQALRVAGIETFGQLAVAQQERLQSAIDAAKLMSPSMATWAKQAQFLADGDEAGFAAYTEHLVGGVEPDAGGRR